MSSSGGGLQPTAILRRPPPGVEPFRVWVPSPVSCPGGATPPPPVDDRSGDPSRARAQAPCPVHTRPAPAGRGWSAAASSIFASRDRPVVGPPRCALGPHPAGQRRSRRRGVAGRQRRPADAGGPGRRPQGHRGLRQRQQAARHLHPLRPGQGQQSAGLQRPRAARPGVGRERAEVHRRRTGPGGGVRLAPTDRPGALLRRRYPGSARRQEEGRLAFDPAARRGP
jgi:hypothetical protein